MEKARKILDSELKKLRTGRADASMLDNVRVKAHDADVALAHVAQVSATDPRALTVNVFDPELVAAVEKAIRSSGMGFNPQVAGTCIKVPIPKVTAEVRQQLSKTAANLTEIAKVSIRRARQNAVDKGKKAGLPKDDLQKFEKEIQTLTDKEVKAADEALKAKQAELTSTD
mmetsp:Transcript_26054/g.68571  ORF Transcript_26054/g.68571 Transcript_26054/m.68571 type:complete len:171 (+) Transcript_26054:319-831(+)